MAVILPNNAPPAGAGGFGNKQQQMNQVAATKPVLENTPLPAPQSVAPLPSVPPAPPKPAPIDLEAIPSLHNVALVRTKKTGHIVIDNVDPACFIVDPNSKRLDDSYAGYKIQRTLSELREAGYKNVDDLESDLTGGDPALSEEVLVRNVDSGVWEQESQYGDLSTKKIWITCLWIKLDVDGDGIAEWRYIVRAGNRILENEPSIAPPMALITPIVQPHMLIGKGLADLSMPIQKVRTSIVRALIDNVNLTVNSRVMVNADNVELGDLLDNRPGGVVRVKDMNSIASMPGASGDNTSAAALLASIDDMRSERTGISKYSQGMDADSLNHTATGIENITQRADMRLKNIARTFAETGVKDLFLLIQRFLSMYQNECMTVKLRGKWVDVDPRAWTNQYSLSVVVGLGTGDKSRQIAQLQQMAQLQQQGLQIGITTPANIYYTAGKLANAMGYQNEEQFFTDPATQPPKPTPPDPQLALIQAQSQAEAAKLQATSQQKIAEMQAKAAIDERAFAAQQQKDLQSVKLAAMLETHKAQLIDARERDKAAADNQYQRENMLLQATIDREKIALGTKGSTVADESQAFSVINNQLGS